MRIAFFSPTSPSVSGRKSTDSRQRILQAAASLFARKGFNAVSVEEIVKAAELAKPALYYYFKDKDDLYANLLKEGFDQRHSILQKHIASSQPWHARLHQLTQALIDFRQENHDLALLSFRMSFSPDEKFPWRKQVLKFCERNFDCLCTFLQEGIDQGHLRKDRSPATIASLLNGQMMFFFLGSTFQTEIPDSKTETDLIISLFLEGAAPKTTK